MLDQIFISQLRLEATIGVYPQERLAPQTLIVDIELTTDIHKAAQSDDLADTIDYDQLIKQLQQWTTERAFNLVETLADYLATKILNTPHVQAVRLKLYKFPAGLPIESAGVVVIRKL
jgi:dihydroneopterin aldolase